MAKKTVEELLKEAEDKIKSRAEKLLKNLTPEQKAAIIKDPKIIDVLMKDINPDVIATYYNINLISKAGEIVSEYSKTIKVNQQKKVAEFVDSLVKLKTESLKNFITINKETFKNKIIELIINGSREDAIKEYFKTTPFTGSQIGTLINTAESDIRRTTVINAYADRPDQRFRYIGGVIPTSSETCTWLMENQNPDGYTMDEIQSGITTPYGIVDAGGRIPNYNCIHTWEPIIE